MKSFLKCYRIEFLKGRHTIIYPLHMGLPVLFILGINTLLRWRRFENLEVDSFIGGCFQILCMFMPLISSVICSLVMEQEVEAGNYQNLLASYYSRTPIIISKLSMLMTLCALSIGLILLGIFVTLPLFWESIPISHLQLIRLGFKFWFCSISLYMIHLFLVFGFGKGVCTVVGFLGVLLSALGKYSPFDFVGYFIPQTWAVRMTSSSYQHPVELGIRLTLTLILALALIIWFNLSENIESHD